MAPALDRIWPASGRYGGGRRPIPAQHLRPYGGATRTAWLALNVARAAMQLVDSAAGNPTYRQSARTRVTSAFGIWLSPLVRPLTIRCPRSQACGALKRCRCPLGKLVQDNSRKRLRSKIWQLALTMPNQPRKPVLLDAQKRGVVVIRPKARSGSRKP